MVAVLEPAEVGLTMPEKTTVMPFLDPTVMAGGVPGTGNLNVGAPVTGSVPAVRVTLAAGPVVLKVAVAPLTFVPKGNVKVTSAPAGRVVLGELGVVPL